MAVRTIYISVIYAYPATKDQPFIDTKIDTSPINEYIIFRTSGGRVDTLLLSGSVTAEEHVLPTDLPTSKIKSKAWRLLADTIREN